MSRFPLKIRIAAIIAAALALLAVEGNRPNPKYARVFFKMAQKAEKEGRSVQAAEYYRKALSHDSGIAGQHDFPDDIGPVDK